MLANPIPQPILRMLEATVRVSGWVVVIAWAYLALVLLGVLLTEVPPYGSLASRQLVDTVNAYGLALVTAIVVFTAVHHLAARLVRSEHARTAT